MAAMDAVTERTFQEEKENDKLKLGVGQSGRPGWFGATNTQVRILPPRNRIDKGVLNEQKIEEARL